MTSFYKKYKTWIWVFGGCSPILFIILFVLGLIVFLILILGLIFGFSGSSSSGGVTTQIGTVNLQQLETAPASWTLHQIYPVSPLITQESPGDTYSIPAPSESVLEADLAIHTTYQIPLIDSCYSTWDIPQEYGGYPCGFAGWPGQCTFWALLNWNNPDMKILGGNAYQFVADAQALGLPVSMTPTVGAIVVWGQGNGYSSNGHVAIVVAVNPQNQTFVVSEMNFYTPWMIDYRVVSSVPGGVGYGNLEGFILPSTPTAVASPTP